MTEPVAFIDHMVQLDYEVRTSPVQRRFDDEMAGGRITGHKCPACSLVYVPPKGFCPMCVVTTGPEHEVPVADRGIVCSFTILTPIQYRGQKERDDYALASLLLDGADSTVGQQRLAGIPLDQVRTGLRVQAEWLPPEERHPDSNPGSWRGLGRTVRHWVPSGEPDAEPAAYEGHTL